MADVFFELSDLVAKPGRHAARLAVLWPLARRYVESSDTRSQLKMGMIALIQWRQRVLDMHRLKWEPTQRSRTALQCYRNCPPAGFITTVRSEPLHTCSHDEICPWCYSRTVTALFDRAKAAMGTSSKLMWARGSVTVPLRKDDAANRQLVDHHRKKMLVLATANNLLCEGLHWALTVEPAEKKGKPALRFVYRILAVMKRGEALAWLPPKWRHGTLYKLNEKKVLSAVAAMSRYPEGLMQKEAEDVVHVLHLCRGLRLSNSSGVLRRKTVGTAAVATKEAEAPTSPEPPGAVDGP